MSISTVEAGLSELIKLFLSEEELLSSQQTYQEKLKDSSYVQDNDDYRVKVTKKIKKTPLILYSSERQRVLEYMGDHFGWFYVYVVLFIFDDKDSVPLHHAGGIRQKAYKLYNSVLLKHKEDFHDYLKEVLYNVTC